MDAGELRVWLLGRIRVTRGGVDLELGRPQRRAVLAWLALAGGRPLGLDDLVAALWPAGPPPSATNIVQTHIKHLRRLLEPDRPARTTCRLLPSVGTGYRLALDPDSVDLFRFRRLAERARAAHRSGDPAGAGDLAGEALRLWRPPPADLPELARHPGVAAATAEADLMSSWRVSRPVADTTAPVPEQLPPDLEIVTGRGEQLRWLDTLVCRSTAPRVAVISGPAGIGKTALAVHWAHRVAAHFPDGQLHADLAGPVRPDEVLRAFLIALGVAPHRVPVDLSARIGRYRSLLAGRRVLVVLDGARRADQVRPLLPGTAGCVVLVTGRDDLPGLVTDGARSVALPLLTAAEARDLLATRLGTARMAAAPEAVDRIVEACAGLPLALALVAAHAVTRPDVPLPELSGRLRPGGVIPWSCRDLEPDAAVLFRRLGVHPGPDVSTAAAAALADLPADRVTRALGELTGAGLAVEHRAGRFALPDLVRAHAAHLAGAADRCAALARVAEHYLRRADAGPEWFATEHAVLLAMLGALAAHGLDRHVCDLARRMAPYLDDRAGQVVVLRAALGAAERLGDRPAQARTHRALARAYSRLDRHGAARRELGHALARYTALGDDAGRADTELSLAEVSLTESRLAEVSPAGAGGRVRAALAHAERALDLHEAAGHPRGRATALTTVGRCHGLLGDHDHALTYCVRALRVHEDLGDRRGAADAWDAMGDANRGLARYRSATRCYRRAVALFAELGDRFAEATSSTRLGDNHRAAGDLLAARRTWSTALAILTDLDHPDAERVRARMR
ncbi:tetratricopeptide repeat protein [Virgisporangium aurantiacum]|uniref:OmpR/PhoB-type domain-containing protein n=1 Tax=Virgisporangium aurantiacum TaxID=175570 RepID=A0A8J3Z534_9ACTN|nr:tetratricopeptide repeat protein [Virgisporangium aurantiacum]GIJ56463.1 hypothetical protein Vau01_039790 [Virgisporangium aurantiacum]